MDEMLVAAFAVNEMSLPKVILVPDTVPTTVLPTLLKPSSRKLTSILPLAESYVHEVLLDAAPPSINTSEPKLILVPDTVPTTAVPLSELALSL